MYRWVYILIQATILIVYVASIYKREKSVRMSRQWVWLFFTGLMVILYAFVRIE